MPTVEIAIQKIRVLPPEQLNQVIQFIEFLEFRAKESDETPTEEVIEGISQGFKEAVT